MVRTIAGEGFAFIPRSLVAEPAAFGSTPGALEPAAGVDSASERYRAAMMQHVLCATVRTELLRTSQGAPAQYVENTRGKALGVDRTRRIFRGVTMAQFADFAFWTSRFPVVAREVIEYMAEWAPGVHEAARPVDEEVPATVPRAHAVPPIQRSILRRTPQNPYG